ncbi:hypothetical protein [Corynebacterium kroppenstedtii]|uniref:hypothetical protein n=1 Tax=Corynebacterium kroppenstedtii TaxID=161879 RepID=UPI002652E759|nr:hypothetical protein [Corynebacterium kroppenstedtii]MDN8623720.1 hypothetical protein [Corynebacterium kroppenstedtii]
MKTTKTNMTALDYTLTAVWWLAVILAIVSLFSMSGARGKIGMFLFFAIIAGLLSYLANARSKDKETGQRTPRKWKIVAPTAGVALLASLALVGSAGTKDAETEAATAPAPTTTAQAETTTAQKTEPATPHKQPSPTKTKDNTMNNGDMGKDFAQWYLKTAGMTSWADNYSAAWAPHIIAVKDGKAGIIQFVTNLDPSDKDGKKIGNQLATSMVNTIKTTPKSELPESVQKTAKQVGVSDITGSKVIALKDIQFQD